MTMFLATVLGWYFVILSLFILFRHEQLRLVMTDLLKQRALFFVLAIITIILGLMMVTSHNIWIMDWPVMITVLSWMVLINGLMRLFFYDAISKKAASCLERPCKMRTGGIVILVLGLFLLYHVYYFSF